MKNIPLSNFESMESIFPEKYVLSEADIDNLMPLKSDAPLTANTENSNRNILEFADIYKQEAFIYPGQGKLF